MHYQNTGDIEGVTKEFDLPHWLRDFAVDLELNIPESREIKSIRLVLIASVATLWFELGPHISPALKYLEAAHSSFCFP